MTSSLSLRGASSSSSSAHQWTYDVFLSGGQDTRKNLTGHLYEALERDGLKTYIDDEQPRSGEEIPSNLLKAIEMSRISVVVFSENYASSAWCLEELTKIFECREKKGQMVLPVFYGVKPADVRNQRGIIGESFGKLEERFRDNPEKVERWKEALTQVTKIPFRHLRGDSRYDTEFIRYFVPKIAEKIARHTDFQDAKHSDGIKSPDRTGSFVQLPQSSSPITDGIESSVQVLNLSSLPSGNGEQGNNSSTVSDGVMLTFILLVIALLQVGNLFETHPVNLWVAVAASSVCLLSHSTMNKIKGTHWAKYSQAINRFRILSGMLVVVSLLSIHLQHHRWWLVFAIWVSLAFMIVVAEWIYLWAERRGVVRRGFNPV